MGTCSDTKPPMESRQKTSTEPRQAVKRRKRSLRARQARICKTDYHVYQTISVDQLTEVQESQKMTRKLMTSWKMMKMTCMSPMEIHKKINQCLLENTQTMI